MAASERSGPLAGVRVLEIGGGIAAAFATRWLAGYGADVVRSEPAAEALDRDEAAFLLPGKRRIAVADTELRELSLAADIVVEDGPPGALAARGLDPRELRAARAALVVTSLTAFGQSGPHAGWRASNLVAHAAGGILSLTGVGSRPPLLNGGEQAWMLLGLNGFAATLAAYYGARLHGAGDWLDVSAQECAAGMLELYGPRAAAEGLPAPRLGNRVHALWGIFRCADGFAGVCALQRQAPAFLAATGEPALAEPRFADPLARAAPAVDAELGALVERWFADKRKADLLALGEKHKVTMGAVLTPLELLASPGLAERGFFDTVSSAGRELRVPGRPFLGLDWRPGELRAAGADTAAVRRDWLGARAAAAASPGEPRRPALRRLPLEGVRIADLSMMWAGPYATRLLAEMGAEVIKIESPRAWDNVRTLLPQPGAPEPWNSSYYFNDYNRDKRSLSLDLVQPRGRELFLKLVAQCDCVIENYRADVLDKLGIGWDVLRAARPDLVLVSMAGFGKTGPERNLVGFGPIIEQMAGMASTTGYGDDGVPYKTGISYGDPIGGIAAAGAVALALLERRRSGRGAWIDLAQRETMAQMIGPAFAAAARSGAAPRQRGNRDARCAPQGVYACAGEDRWVAISARDDAEFQALAHGIGAPELAPLDLVARRARHDELDRAIERWTRTRAPLDAARELQAVGVAAAPVQDALSIHDDPHLLARGAWLELPHPKMAKPWKQPASAWQLANAQPRPRRHAPLFGEHNREILCGLLRLPEAELASLTASGVIGDAPLGAKEG